MNKKNKPLSDKIKEVEKDLTKGLIKWRLKQAGRPVPDEELLEEGSELVVERAHEVARQQGKSLLSELKKAKKEFLKAYKDDGDTTETE